MDSALRCNIFSPQETTEINSADIFSASCVDPLGAIYIHLCTTTLRRFELVKRIGERYDMVQFTCSEIRVIGIVSRIYVNILVNFMYHS